MMRQNQNLHAVLICHVQTDKRRWWCKRRVCAVLPFNEMDDRWATPKLPLLQGSWCAASQSPDTFALAPAAVAGT